MKAKSSMILYNLSSLFKQTLLGSEAWNIPFRKTRNMSLRLYSTFTKLHHTLSNIYFSRSHFRSLISAPWGVVYLSLLLSFVLKQLRCNFVAPDAFRPLRPTRFPRFSHSTAIFTFRFLSKCHSLNHYLHLIRTSDEANMLSIFIIVHH